MDKERLQELQEKMEKILRKQQELEEDIRELKTLLQAFSIPSQAKKEPQKTTTPAVNKKPIRNLEKEIGTNLISKIGIVVLLIGVSLGVKYSIDKNLITPLTRILLSYLLGFGLLVSAWKLHTKMKNFARVLFGGSLAVFYFTTFFAYSLYGFLSPAFAFLIMFLCTVISVLSSLKFNSRIIAALGLVAAYAVPLLVSRNEANSIAFFSYILLVNIGILIVSLKKNWTSIFYLALLSSYVFLLSWIFFKFEAEKHSYVAFGFSSAFFLLFFATGILGNLLQKIPLSHHNLLILLTNTTLFWFATQFYTLKAENSLYFRLFAGAELLLFYGIAALWFKTRKFPSEDFGFWFTNVAVSASVLLLTIPFGGDSNTFLLGLLAWASARTGAKFKVEYFLKVGAGLAIFSFFGLMVGTQPSQEALYPFFNIVFATSLILSVAFYLILKYFNMFEPSETFPKDFHNFENVGLHFITVFSFFMTFYAELQDARVFLLEQYFPEKNGEHFITAWDSAFNFLESIYALSFVTWLLPYLLVKKNTFTRYLYAGIGLYTLFVAYFVIRELLNGAYWLENYPMLFKEFPLLLGIHYLHYIAIFLLAFRLWKWKLPKYGNILKLLLLVFFLLVGASEIEHLFFFFKLRQGADISVSIFWGAFAVFFIVLGIRKNIKELRFLGMGTLAITLLKILFKDVQGLTLPEKVIVFTVIGILLLLASFWYNKYKDKL